MKTASFLLILALGSVPASLFGQIPLNLSPSRVIGHAQLTPSTDRPNLVEGRELSNPLAVAVDTSTSPPALYVADAGNNRVLGWRNANGFGNGAPADIVVGQRDRMTTFIGGPGTALASGLNRPSGLAVDGSGSLYVVDSGNNRILRFRQPFQQPGELKTPDLVIGQTSLNTREPNAGGISPRSVSTIRSDGAVLACRLAFDAQGNLYFTDAGNHRLLRYPAAALGQQAANAPAADLVLGQPDFLTASVLQLTEPNRKNKERLREPSSVALDQAGRVYVTDALNRVMVYVPSFRTGQDASRIIGVEGPRGYLPAIAIHEYTLGVVASNPTRYLAPDGVFTIGNEVYVVDTPAHRVLRYSPFENWPREDVSFSPPAVAVIGQDSIVDSRTQLTEIINRGRAAPDRNTFAFPSSAVFAAGELFIADSSNHRVLAFPNPTGGPQASLGEPYLARRVLGQVSYELNAVNLIEGREFFGASAVVLDTRSNPPRLYVSDTFNNRVLGYADARRVRPGVRADLVIGQPDFFRSLINHPTNDVNRPSDTSLYQPAGLAVDSAGNLWVADRGNARVLRFPSPFANTSGAHRADLVIGQSSFTAKITDATARTLSSPWGVAFTAEGHLLVSDAVHNRVLFYQRPLSSGMSATKVVGQSGFDAILSGSAIDRLSSPRHIAVDSDDRLYVADSGNDRVLIFGRAPVLPASDSRAAFTLTRVGAPLGVFVSDATGEIWVADTRGNRALRYPRFDVLVTQGDAFDYALPSITPLALAQDRFGSLFIADGLHRVAIHFPGLAAVNGASYLPRLTPGMVTSVFSPALSAIQQTAVFNELPQPIPLPTTLADTQVLVDDVPARLYFVSPGQINFLMPMNAPSSGIVELEVASASVGQIIASSRVRMDVASPALFTSPPTGTGQIAALNQDNSVNTSQNPVRRGEVVQLFGTGQGFVAGAPPDGSPPAGAVNTDVKPRVIVNAAFLDPSDILYSGLAPGLVGVWQINIRIPLTVPPSDAIQVVMLMNDIPSNDPQNPRRIVTTIAVR